VNAPPIAQEKGERLRQAGRERQAKRAAPGALRHRRLAALFSGAGAMAPLAGMPPGWWRRALPPTTGLQRIPITLLVVQPVSCPVLRGAGWHHHHEWV
jgi:hypothetical protein